MPNIVFYVDDVTYGLWLRLGKNRNDQLRNQFRNQLKSIVKKENEPKVKKQG